MRRQGANFIRSPLHAPMLAPEFWNGPPGIAAGLLMPFGAVWSAAARLRRAVAHPYRAPVPVVCVGNLVVGGAGKTPVVLSLAALFAAHGLEIHIVTRGHGGRRQGPVRVDPARDDAAAIGDEALLIAARAPCWIARDRAAGVRAAIAAGAAAILLDDGFQNPTVAKDLALVVVDAGYGFGNCRVFPAGPLREPVEEGLMRAAAVVLIGSGEEPSVLRRANRPILRTTLDPVAGKRYSGARVLAFAGIGRPAKFFRTLERLGATLVAARPFPDHHPYREHEIAALRRAAGRSGAVLVTTAKDWVRLPPAWRTGIAVLEVDLHWMDSAALERLTSPILRIARDHQRDRRAAGG